MTSQQIQTSIDSGVDQGLDLDGLLAEAVAHAPSPRTGEPAVAGQWPSGAAKPKDQAIAKIAYTHDAMIDLLIANPAMSQNDLAARFGYTASWVSQVMSSDAFQMRMAERREQIIDPTLRLTVKQNFDALVVRSLDILKEKLNKPSADIPDGLVLRTLDIGGRLAGYGVKEPPAAPPITPVSIAIHLETLGSGLVTLLQRKKAEAGLIEGDHSDISQAIEQQRQVKSAQQG